jgi:hypothetical protein
MQKNAKKLKKNQVVTRSAPPLNFCLQGELLALTVDLAWASNS